MLIIIQEFKIQMRTVFLLGYKYFLHAYTSNIIGQG